jgi:flagellar hook-associated protein 3 FlgL
MSISDLTMFNSLAYSISAVEENLQQSQIALATGKQINQPSDNPTAWEQSTLMTGRESAMSNDVTLAGSVQTRLAGADSALNQAENAVNAAIVTATQGSDATVSTAQMQSLAQSVQGMLSEVIDAANIQQLGSYIFSGTQTLTQPYSASGVYAGNAGSNSVTFSDGTSLQETFNGQAIFGDNTSGAIGALTSLVSALSAGNKAGVAAALPALQSALQQLATARTALGVTMNRLQTLVTNTNGEIISVKSAQSNLVDANVAQLAANVQEQLLQENALISLASGFSKIPLVNVLA